MSQVSIIPPPNAIPKYSRIYASNNQCHKFLYHTLSCLSISDCYILPGIYLTCTMTITTLSMVLTVFVLNLHHVTDRPVPPWLERLVLVYIARIVGKCSAGREASHLIKRNMHAVLATNEPNDLGGSLESPQSQVSCRRAQLRIIQSGEDSDSAAAFVEVQESKPSNSEMGFPDSTKYEVWNGQYSRKDEDLKTYDDKVDYGKEWRKVAEVFDRLFFWLFLMAILISTLVLFHPLTDSYLKTWT